MALADGGALSPYPDGRWWLIDHLGSTQFPLMCRGNTGEVYPNVVTPLTGSIVNVPFARGQTRLASEMGLATRRQLAEFDGVTSALAAVHAGYLFANVSLARSAASRTPGLTVDMVDNQMFGLSGAPAHVRVRGERSPVATARSMAAIGRGLLRPNDRLLLDARRQIDAAVGAAGPAASATDAELIARGTSAAPVLERMMHDLLRASSFAGIGRSMIERILGLEASGDEAGTVNRLTAGIGTVESAEPAVALWALGRLAATDPTVASMFDDGLDGLDRRLRTSTASTVEQFVNQFDAFRAAHGSRGPDEWELASPTWGSEPAIGLAMIDRLRHAPAERDPVEVGRRLAVDRDALVSTVRASVGRARRRPLDVALRAATFYGSQREATKAAVVRFLNPMRQGFAELARRHDVPHDDLFLLTIDELPGFVADPSKSADVVAERRVRRDYLQARIPPFWFHGEIPPPHTWVVRAERMRPDAAPRTLHGIGVCSGTATGPARVIDDPSDPGALQPGDILVAPITDPAWTPLFLAAAGVVVDVGAQQSHAAIVARELGIPAAVSVTGASTTIPDGAVITVDGGTGIVTVH